MVALDLLNQKPPPRPQTRQLHDALTFCFARGESEERLIELTMPTLRASTFAEDCFAEDLFLDELLKGAFVVTAQGRRFDASRKFLKRVLTAPPGRPSVELRQGILRELDERPALRMGLEAAYVSLRGLRRNLAGADTIGGRTGSLRRRIDILISLRRSLDELAEAFRSSRSSLARVAQWAETIREGEAFERLARLLDFEDRRSVLESRLQVGFDGTLRRFDIVRATEVEHRGFSRGRVTRFFRQLLGLLKGYRFSEEDVMAQLLDGVFTDLEVPLCDMLSLCSQFEFYLAALGFKDFCDEKGRMVCLASFSGHGGEQGSERSGEQDTDENEAKRQHATEGSHRRHLKELFNPWLLIQGVSAVPCTEETSDARQTVIVTGPNSGGKTRLLQSLAIAQLLGQVGVFVPAAEAQLVWVDQMFLSLLERVEASQEEGRLGMELLRIRRVFESSGARSLIVMDELCSGTNPSEGEQIFEMVLDLLDELRPQVVISTHFLDFAGRLEAEQRSSLAFRQVELGPRDVPTYRFLPGVAKTSLARNTASRLGVTRDELLGLVEEHKRLDGLE